jgi:apolipoprotein N-acyltransferase
MWVALLPVMFFAINARGWSAALAVFVAIAAGSGNLWHYFVALGFPPVVRVIILGVPSITTALCVLLFRALLRRRAWWSAVIAFPAASVTFEWLMSRGSPHGTAGSIAYSQLAFPAFLQTASLTGPLGMSFVLSLFPAAIVTYVAARRASPRVAASILGASSAIVAALLVFGLLRLQQPIAGPQVRVGLVGSDGPNEGVIAPGAKAEAMLREYAKQAEGLVARGAEAVVIPEKLAVLPDGGANYVDAIFQPLADRTRAVIVVGVLAVTPSAKFNEARVYTAGRLVERYHKQHMLPPHESNLTPGTALTQLTMPSGVWGVQICKDMDFTALSRRYGAAGTGLMLVPGWDFFMDWIAHGHMAIMRGVESGFAVVRAAKGGSLFVSDNRGRLLGEIKSDAAPYSTLLVDVPVAHANTLYQRWGDWFVWVAVALCMLSFAPLLRRRAPLDLKSEI